MRTSFIIAMVSFLLFTNGVQAQRQVGWMKKHGGISWDIGKVVLQMPDSNYIICGPGYSFGSGDLAVLIVDQDGKEITHNSFYPGRDVSPIDMIRNNDGDYVIAGDLIDTFPTTRRDIFLMKVDSAANLIWSHTYGYDTEERYGTVFQAADNSYIITGQTTHNTAGYRDLLMIRTDENGDSIWTKRFGTVNDEWGKMSYQFNDGGYLSVAMSTTPPFPNDSNKIYITKSKANGDTIYTKMDQDIVTDIRWATACLDSGFLVTGPYIDSNLLPVLYLKKFDKDGNFLWQKEFDGLFSENVTYVAETVDKDILLCGAFEVVGGTEAFIIKTDSLGNLIWSRMFGDKESDGAFWVIPTFDNGYILTGATDIPGTGKNAILLVKTDSNGCVWYPGAGFYTNADTLLLGDMLLLTDTSKVLPEDSLHQLVWDFGDGNGAVATPSPTHIYSQPGTYTVTLEAFNRSGCSDVAQYSVFVKDTTTTTNNIHSNQFPLDVSLIPNPFTDHTTIKLGGGNSNHHYSYSLYNTLGEQVRQARFTGTTTTLNRAQLSKGVYFLQLQGDNGQSTTRKLVIQ